MILFIILFYVLTVLFESRMTITLDGIIDISDVVAVASYVANMENNPLSNQSLINADVHGDNDGVTSTDVLAIQQYIAKIIKDFS